MEYVYQMDTHTCSLRSDPNKQPKLVRLVPNTSYLLSKLIIPQPNRSTPRLRLIKKREIYDFGKSRLMYKFSDKINYVDAEI